MKYIILAQPKSASTSLLKTLGILIGESYGQQVKSENANAPDHSDPRRAGLLRRCANKALARVGLKLVPVSTGDNDFLRLRDEWPAMHYPLMSSVHVDICDFEDGKIPFTPLFSLQKQHFPPTEGNLIAFRNTPKIILTRDADQTLDSYLRMTSLPGYFRFQISNNPDFREALKKELLAWQAGWIREAEQHGGLVLTFEDITKRTPDSLELALREFGISRPEARIRSQELAKERYTGGGAG